ncbi:MAG: GWxTD domain-containing protein [Pseudonocardiales bacterium]|nr:GWxTD domain-containing protein [Pseudonocardiales bacterium]
MAGRNAGKVVTVRLAWMVSLALTIPLLGAQVHRAADPRVIVRTIRSYRAEQRRTQVDAFVQVPLALMQPTTDGPDGILSYRMAGRVIDSTGLTLLQQSWRNHAPAAIDRSEAYAVDMLRFSIAPGRYRLEMTVEDSVSGRQVVSGVDLSGFSSAPPASDLLLSPQVRPATASDTEPRPAELRWGRMLVTAAAQLQLTPLRPEAYYLLEAYSTQEKSGRLEMRVADSTGRVVFRSTPVPIHVEAGGGVLEGHLSLAGLPPATYVMTAALELGQDSAERTATFVMAGLAETLQKDVRRREAAGTTDDGYFAAMNGEELEAAKAPLELIAESRELEAWQSSLSLNAKRNFLAHFWAARDQTPDTPRNEAREQFYGQLNFANQNYRQSGHDHAGWRSDRGRIYLRKGAPDEVLRRGAEGPGGRLQSRALAYEVWHYTRGKDAYYIFVDRSGTGAYALVHSNDVRQSKLANWNEFFGRDDLQDIERFLGTDVFRDNRAY